MRGAGGLVPFLLLLLLACARCGAAETGPAEIRGERVTLKISPAERSRPELVRLAAELDRAAGEMARRVPIALSSPIAIVVEPDYVAQGRSVGEIGETVRGRAADLHLVYHPDDLPAY